VTDAAGPPPPRCRAIDLGITIGSLPSGPTGTIVDVPDVLVGHATVWRDEPGPPDGRGVARTGVTAVIPYGVGDLFAAPVPAAVAVLNGAGELTGAVAIAERGVLETPVLLTGSMQVGRVLDATVAAMAAAEPAIGVGGVVRPVVGECDDGHLNDTRVVQVGDEDVRAALDGAAGAEDGPVAEGAVGAGTGMSCLGFKGGIGSASRLVGDWTVGVLLLADFGEADRLTIDGVHVGPLLRDDAADPAPSGGGSCIAVIATDAPLDPRQLRRVATRAGLGLARTGSYAHHAGGEIFLAFSTAEDARRSRPPAGPAGEAGGGGNGGGEPTVTRTVAEDWALDGLFTATVEATEEAVLNCLCAADTVTGRDGRTVPGLPLDRVRDLLACR
jgi:D-aminopeptidase